MAQTIISTIESAQAAYKNALASPLSKLLPDLGFSLAIASSAIATVAGLAKLKASQATPEEQEELFEELWARGGFSFQAANYNDFLVDLDTNQKVYNFWLKKVRERVRSLDKADILAPLEQPYPVATKRCSLEQDYYESLDRDNVDVIGLKTTPIQSFTAAGIKTEDGKERQHDYVILATGYDNMTGSLTGMGLRGKDGIDMKERWREGVWTYLGIMASGNPNLFMVYGPQGTFHLLSCLVISANHLLILSSDCVYQCSSLHRDSGRLYRRLVK